MSTLSHATRSEARSIKTGLYAFRNTWDMNCTRGVQLHGACYCPPPTCGHLCEERLWCLHNVVAVTVAFLYVLLSGAILCV